MKKITQYHPGRGGTGDHARTPSAHHFDADQILDQQLTSRKKWECFDLEQTTLVPLTWAQWDYYEINNGYVAYGLGRADDSILRFRELNHPLDEIGGRNWDVVVPARCSEFTFDLSQDVLVTAEAIAGYVQACDSDT
jgi:hypothetical protein